MRLGSQTARLKPDESPSLASSSVAERFGFAFFPINPSPRSRQKREWVKEKGPEYWVAVVKPGRILYEMEGVPESVAREAMRLAAQKLPVHTKFVMREEQGGE